MRALAVSHPRTGPRAARLGASEGRFLLAALLSLAGIACGYAALRLEALVGRFDTLAFLSADPAGKLAQLRLAFVLGGGCLALLAFLALLSWRLATGGLAMALLMIAGLTGPLSKTLLAGERGLEESLLYRARGLVDIGLVGGLFLLFLTLLPGILALRPTALETTLTRLASRANEGWKSSPGIRRTILAGVFLVTALAIGQGILRDFPNSSDENSYLTQAGIFASGRLWIPSPPHPEFFRARSFVMDTQRGRFFAKAFPGWAGVLSLGVLAGAPWLINPLLSALTLLLTGSLAASLLGRGWELPVLGMVALNPFFLFNAASYFNHPLALFLMTLFLLAVVRWERGGSDAWGLVAGAAAGLALTVRPASALLLTGPFLLYLVARRIRQQRWQSLVMLVAPLAACAAAIGFYNRLLFGSPWSTGYQAYDPADIRMGFGFDNFATTGWWLLKLLLWTLPGSLAGIFFLARRRDLRSWIAREPLMALLAGGFLLQAAGHLLFQNKGSNEYGPRYYYDGWVFLALLAAAGWKRVAEEPSRGDRARRGLILGGACSVAVTLVLTMPLLSFHYRDKIDHNRDLYTRMESTGLPTALVFLKTGSGRMPPGDLVRNPADFRTGIVYARDLGQEARRQLAALYSDRPALVYSYDPYRRVSTLVPMETEEAP